MKRHPLLFAFLGLFWFTLCATARAEPPRGMDVPLTTIEGETLRLSDFRGKVVLVNFWATWCPPCLEEIPALVNIQTRYRDRGFTVIGIDFMETPDPKRLAEFVKEHGINYPIVYGDSAQLSGLARDLGGVFGLPVTKILDRQGHVSSSHVGGLTEEKINRFLAPLFDGGATTAAGKEPP